MFGQYFTGNLHQVHVNPTAIFLCNWTTVQAIFVGSLGFWFMQPPRASQSTKRSIGSITLTDIFLEYNSWLLFRPRTENHLTTDRNMTKTMYTESRKENLQHLSDVSRTLIQNGDTSLKLDGQGKARREAARRHNSECKINLSCRNSSLGNGSRPTAQRWLACSAALRPMWHDAGQSPLRSRLTAIAAGGIWTT